MATTLLQAVLDGVKPQPQTLAPAGETSALQRLISAKSGRAIDAEAEAPADTLQEQVARTTAKAQQEVQDQDTALSRLKLDQQEQQQQQQFQQSNKQIDERALGVKQEFNQRLSQSLQDIEQSNRQLYLQKDASKLEQVGFLMRLGDQKYVDRLQVEGRRSRLDNATSFNEALARSVFSDEMDLFGNDLDFRRALRADDRAFTEQLAGMDLDFAMKIATSESREANSRLMWTGAGNVASGAVQAGLAMKRSESGTTASSSGGSASASTGDSIGGVGQQMTAP